MTAAVTDFLYCVFVSHSTILFFILMSCPVSCIFSWSLCFFYFLFFLPHLFPWCVFSSDIGVAALFYLLSSNRGRQWVCEKISWSLEGFRLRHSGGSCAVIFHLLSSVFWSQCLPSGTWPLWHPAQWVCSAGILTVCLPIAPDRLTLTFAIISHASCSGKGCNEVFHRHRLTCSNLI